MLPVMKMDCVVVKPMLLVRNVMHVEKESLISQAVINVLRIGFMIMNMMSMMKVIIVTITIMGIGIMSANLVNVMLKVLSLYNVMTMENVLANPTSLEINVTKLFQDITTFHILRVSLYFTKIELHSAFLFFRMQVQ